jgi:hypothetical protein
MYDKIAMERYKDMAASKKKPFVLQHCWTLLEHSEKWKLSDNEAPPKRELSPKWMMMRVTMRAEETRASPLSGGMCRTRRESSSLREKLTIW